MSVQTLTADQKRRMEESRRRAIELRALKNNSQNRSGPAHRSLSADAQITNATSGSVQQTPKSQSLSQPTSASSSIYNQQTQKSASQRSSGSNGIYSQQTQKPFVSVQSGCYKQQLQKPESSPSLKESSNSSASRSVSSSQFKKGVFCLISRDRFELQMEYYQPAIDVIRGVEGRQYDPNSRRWNFPITQHSKALSCLKSVSNMYVEELPKLVLDTFLKPVNEVILDTVDISCIQRSMMATLKDFQKDGVRFAVSKGGRVLIADDMGLGKTLQALAIADFYKKEWPLLIVCPSSMRFQWLEEIQKHLLYVQHQQHRVLVVTNSKDSINSAAHIVIISYDLMTAMKDSLINKKFGVVIMDESHHLKNRKTKRAQAGTDIVKNCKRCILLSGTPILSRPQELFCQLHALKPSIFHNFFEFGVRYCDGKQEKFGWNFSGSSNMTEMKLLLSELVMIRRLKSEVLSQLPPKRREVVILESSGRKLDETSEYAKLLKENGLNGMKKHSTLLQYFHETGLAKIKAIKQYVQSMVENGEKFLVFAHHGQVLQAICEAVEDMKADYIRIDGSVPSDDRKLMCAHFQENESCLVAALSIKAANTGLTLTAAHLVVFAELYWNPAELTQGEDRVHRIGQEDSVLVQYLVQHGTADDVMWPMIEKKLNVLSKAGLSSSDSMDAETRVVKDESGKDITDYFKSSNDDDLDGIDFGEFDTDFSPPDPKKAKSN